MYGSFSKAVSYILGTLLMIKPFFFGGGGRIAIQLFIADCELGRLAMLHICNLSPKLYPEYAHMILCKSENVKICISTPCKYLVFSTFFLVRQSIF